MVFELIMGFYSFCFGLTCGGGGGGDDICDMDDIG